jgi:Holliday junction resolvase
VTTKSKAKGSQFERDVVAYLKSKGWRVSRAYGAGAQRDVGDVYGLWRTVVECKNEKRIDLGGYMKELQVEMANAEAELGAVIVKRRNKPTADAYVVMPMHLWVQALERFLPKG